MVTKSFSREDAHFPGLRVLRGDDRPMLANALDALDIMKWKPDRLSKTSTQLWQVLQHRFRMQTSFFMGKSSG
jgi:hypothetical protein